ncbi:translation initiation factor IF-2-like [Drosophila albomicans]|uniref:Translation initiation factor IF-2-like n=1 Tax=Drosophila albomicans TaxID=7291 RepID=A0A6P8WTZ6_DROAB|nr:translation initiation factor IF-2-like [Drosophila albomicans]
MFKCTIVICALIACVAAKPGLLHAPLVAAAPVIAAPAPAVVTATSSQVVARNFNGIATAPLIAPVAPIAPIAAPIVRAVAPVAAPLAAATFAHPVAAPVIAKYAAAPLAAPFAYSAPLSYAAAPAPLFI